MSLNWPISRVAGSITDWGYPDIVSGTRFRFLTSGVCWDIDRFRRSACEQFNRKIQTISATVASRTAQSDNRSHWPSNWMRSRIR